MDDRELTPDDIRQLAEHHIRILEPGHALIVRVPPDWMWTEVHDLHTALNALAWEIDPRCKVIVVPALEAETRPRRSVPGLRTRKTARRERPEFPAPA